MFDKHLDEVSARARDFLSPIFNEWVEKLEVKKEDEKQEDKFAFLFDGIIPLHYAIEQVRAGKDDPTTKAPFETPQKLFKETLYSPESVNSATRNVSDLGDPFGGNLKIEPEKLTSIKHFNNVITDIKDGSYTYLTDALNIISQPGFINFGSADAQVSNSLDASAQLSNVDATTSPTKSLLAGSSSASFSSPSPRKRSSSVISLLLSPQKKSANTDTLDLNTPIRDASDNRIIFIKDLVENLIQDRDNSSVKTVLGLRTQKGIIFGPSNLVTGRKDKGDYEKKQTEIRDVVEVLKTRLEELIKQINS